MTDSEIKIGTENKVKLKRLKTENVGLKMQERKNAFLITNNY